jgi:hypothetical protein
VTREVDPVEFVGYQPDARLLGEDLRQLPASVGQPPQPLPESPARRQVVRLGATMTGVTLIVGVALTLLGLVEAIVDGGLVWFVVLAVGLVLAVTHWGWVHVAELTGNSIEARRQGSVEDLRLQWLSAIEPYSRWEVVTRVDEDGSITIDTLRHRPVRREEQTFTFGCEVEAREVHSPDKAAAAVTERAELLRREAAAETRRAREQFEAARDAYDRVLIAADDEQQRRAALRAASQALSERINSNLRDPPLTE